MVKKNKPKKDILVPPHLILAQDNTELFVDIKEMNEQWSECTLKDGAIIRLKPVIIEIRKAKNQFAPNGDPIYLVKSTVITDIKVPENLKRTG